MSNKCNQCDFASSQAGHLRRHMKSHNGKCQSNATNVIVLLLRQAIWGHIWKCTVEKSQTNATNVTLHLLGQVIWGDIWKHTLEKSQINAINVTLHPHRQAIWGGIWKHIVEKSQASATYLDRVGLGNLTKPTLPLLMQAIWRHIWKRTVEKSQTNATMWLCILSCKRFEDTFENTQRRKVE